MIGPFIFMDQSGPTRVPKGTAGGVREHPHAGLATFTYLLEGAVMHRDSAGNATKVFAGDVALMMAGRGITHEELPDPDDQGAAQSVYFVQMWLALPDELEDMAPALEVHRHVKIPEAELSGGTVCVLIGTGWGKTAPTTTYIDTVFADLNVRGNGSMPIACSCEERALYLLEGDASLDGDELQLHTLALLESGGEPTISSSKGCRAILLGGAHFPSERFISGSFVASSLHKIEDWMRRYRAGDFPSINRAEMSGAVHAHR
jgi:redox-sensitive bicupin YhaK (pirin superfamily)